jgi:hypothetical protein
VSERIARCHSLVDREKFDGVLVYLARDARERQRQSVARRQMVAGEFERVTEGVLAHELKAAMPGSRTCWASIHTRSPRAAGSCCNGHRGAGGTQAGRRATIGEKTPQIIARIEELLRDESPAIR